MKFTYLCTNQYKRPVHTPMIITRIYATPDGASHFQDVTVGLDDAGEIGRLSAAWPTGTLTFRETGGDYDFDWHHPPTRQLVILLDGAIEIEVSDGATRRFAGGDVLLVEDLTGRGHRTRAVEPGIRRSLFVTVPEQASLDYTDP
jgi:hypothetical protein